jgi:hypothetical protein
VSARGCNQSPPHVRSYCCSAALLVNIYHLLYAGTNPKKDPTPLPAFVQQLETTCPFSFFRVSTDAAPQFESIVYNANRAVPYLGVKPLSRPGCWAYADSESPLISLFISMQPLLQVLLKFTCAPPAPWRSQYDSYVVRSLCFFLVFFLTFVHALHARFCFFIHFVVAQCSRLECG